MRRGLAGAPLAINAATRAEVPAAAYSEVNGMTVTLGIDLAAQPAKTAVCAIEWRDRRGVVRVLGRGRIVVHCSTTSSSSTRWLA
jgi:hypothetical protein